MCKMQIPPLMAPRARGGGPWSKYRAGSQQGLDEINSRWLQGTRQVVREHTSLGTQGCATLLAGIPTGLGIMLAGWLQVLCRTREGPAWALHTGGTLGPSGSCVRAVKVPWTVPSPDSSS